MPSYIELFTGAGGGILAHSILDGFALQATAEIEPYPNRVLLARLFDGSLPAFDQYQDVCAVDWSRYRGVGLVAGGFPCQGLSVAGRQLGMKDPRTRLVWQMLRAVAETQPRWVFAENSPTMRYQVLPLIAPELQAMGYGSMAWGVLSAEDLGAYHVRDRMWLLAVRDRAKIPHVWGDPRATPAWGMLTGDRLTAVGPPTERRVSTPSMPPSLRSLDRASRIRVSQRLPTLAKTDHKPAWTGSGLERQLRTRIKPLRDMLPYYLGGRETAISPVWAEWFMGWPMDWTDVEGTITPAGLLAWRNAVTSNRYWTAPFEAQVLPALIKGSAVSRRVDRIKALGNGQVPVVASAAFRILRSTLGG